MTKFLTLILVTTFISCINTESGSECQDIRIGKFKLVSENSGTTLITRTDNEQIEVNEDTGIESKHEVKWIDDCTYQLFNSKTYKGSPHFNKSTTDTITVQIIEIKNKSYKVTTRSNFADLKIEAELFIIE